MASERLEQIRATLKHLAESLRRIVTEPWSELTRWQKAVRYAYDLGRHGAIQLRRDRAPQMAAALSFRLLFGLLPLLVVGSILVKAMGGFDQFQDTLAEFLAAVAGEGAEDGARGAVSEWLLGLFAKVEEVNLAAIGWVGVAVLGYSVISLMVTIEGCFNSIYRAPEGRFWAHRVPIYWTLVTIAPALIGLTVYIDRQFDLFLTETLGFGAGPGPGESGPETGPSLLLRGLPVLWSLCATWLVMFVVYKLLPNTRVQVRPALVGALVATILLEIGKRTLGAYLENAVGFQYVYGALGLIPLFMFWVYMMWLAILFGLEVSATIQKLAGRTPREMEASGDPTGMVEPAAVLVVMEAVAERFREARPATAAEVSDETGLEESVVQLILARLAEGGFVHRLDREDDDLAYGLARPPERIGAEALIELGFSIVDAGGMTRHPVFVERLRDAQRALAASATLAQLASAPPVASGVDQVPPAS